MKIVQEIGKHLISTKIPQQQFFVTAKNLKFIG